MPSIEEILKKEIVYKIDNMVDVDIQKDIAYNSMEKEGLLMDLYSPANLNKNEKLPAVILVHGEAKEVNFKETGYYDSCGRLIAASGLKAVVFNHKVLSDGFSLEEVNADIDMLIKYLIENADSLNIDKDKLAIWCFSGGVPFGLYAGMHDGIQHIKGIIAYYGFCEFASVKKIFHLNIEDEIIEKYSAINLINENLDSFPPILIARAGLDNPILNESIDKFIAKALKYNLTIDIYNHSTGEHAFELFNDNNRTHEIVSESLNFLKKHLK